MIKKALASVLLALGFLPAKAAMAIPPSGFYPPQDDTKRSLFDVFRLDHQYWLAAHRSHSSHRSHRSHTSHRSSSGSYSLPKSYYNPSPAPQPKYVTPPPGEPLVLIPETGQYEPLPQKQKILPGNSNKFQLITKQVQLALFAYGYYKGEVDGVVGPGTKEALTKMQADYGLKVTGTITPQTLDALKIMAR